MENSEFDEIMDMLVDKLTEYGIQEQRRHCSEIDELIEAQTALSVKAKKVLDKMDEDSREILVQYYEQSEKIADIQIKHLYIQGAKDCVRLLKKLTVF